VEDLRHLRLGVDLQGGVEGLLTARDRRCAADLELDQTGLGAYGEEEAQDEFVSRLDLLLQLDVDVEGDGVGVLPRLKPEPL